MHYLYHLVPENFVGDKIVPLSKLQEISCYYEDSKIEKAPKLINQRIDDLDCTTSDVIFLTLISPKELEEEQIRRTNKDLKGAKFFKIPLNMLEKDKLLYYRTTDSFKENRYLPFTDVLEYYKHFTKEDHDLWLTRYDNNPTIGAELFTNTYQVLYKGEIPIKDLEIIEL